MEWSLLRRLNADRWLPIGLCVAASAVASAQAVPPADREALVRLRVERGGRVEDVEVLLRRVEEAAAKGLPAEPLANKIREGLAKGADPARIDAVVQQMATHLEAADRLLRDLAPAGEGRGASVTLLAEAIGGGVTPEEIQAIGRTVPPGVAPATPVSPDRLAGAAKGLSFIKAARLSPDDATAVIVEATRRGFRANDLLELGRDVKRRERDYQAGRATLRALRDAIARGDRPEQLFREPRVEAVRPAARPEPPVVRPEPAERPQVPDRPQRPERPQAPERPATNR